MDKKNTPAENGRKYDCSKTIVTIVLVVIAAISFLRCIGSNDFDTVSTNLTVFMLSVLATLVHTGVWDTTYTAHEEEEEEPKEEK